MWPDKPTQHPWVVYHCDDEVRSFTVLAHGAIDKDSLIWLHLATCSNSGGRNHSVWLGRRDVVSTQDIATRSTDVVIQAPAVGVWQKESAAEQGPTPLIPSHL